MKKILLMTTRDFRHTGGVERYLQNFITYASRQKWPLTILLSERAKGLCGKREAVEYVYYPDAGRRLQNFFRFLNPLLSQVVLRQQVRPVLDFLRPEVVLTRDWNVVLLMKALRKDIPVYFMPGSLLKMDLQFDGPEAGSVLYRLSRRLQSKLLVALERSALRQADAVVVFSQALKKRIGRHYRVPEQKIHVLPMGVDVRDVSGNGAVENGMILSVGRLAVSKNLHTAVAAMKGMEGYRLVIAGDGPQRKALEEQIRTLKLQERVSLLGKQQDLSEYYRRCDVFLHLSYYENFGQVLLEAMLHGKPPVVLDPAGEGVHTASAEVIRDGYNGFFVANDPAAVGAKIREVARMKRQSLAQNCREFARQFTFDRHLEALGRLMEKGKK